MMMVAEMAMETQRNRMPGMYVLKSDGNAPDLTRAFIASFSQPIAFEKGEIVYRQYTAPAPIAADSDDYDCAPAPGTDPAPLATGFWYCDLV